MKEDNILIKFGKNVQKIRLKRNLTFEEVSILTGIKISYLKKIEKGEAKRVSTKHLFLFVEVFEVGSSRFFEGM
ncbi:MAG: helix-turn-helix transcriptional regulator [Candidatus Gastranaerophilales bacterium]|nr:helix-turn-helix transcriptional regulator [Candidatus Gastranaerophilales bacterium]